MVHARRESALRRVGSRRIWLVMGCWPGIRGVRNRHFDECCLYFPRSGKRNRAQGRARAALSAVSGDVGYGVIRERQARMRGPGLGGHGRCALQRLRLPAAQMHENRSHHDGVFNQRDDTHRAFALGTFEWVRFIDLADQPRPGEGRSPFPSLAPWRAARIRSEPR